MAGVGRPKMFDSRNLHAHEVRVTALSHDLENEAFVRGINPEVRVVLGIETSNLGAQCPVPAQDCLHGALRFERRGTNATVALPALPDRPRSAAATITLPHWPVEPLAQACGPTMSVPRPQTATRPDRTCLRPAVLRTEGCQPKLALVRFGRALPARHFADLCRQWFAFGTIRRDVGTRNATILGWNLTLTI